MYMACSTSALMFRTTNRKKTPDHLALHPRLSICRTTEDANTKRRTSKRGKRFLLPLNSFTLWQVQSVLVPESAEHSRH